MLKLSYGDRELRRFVHVPALREYVFELWIELPRSA